MKNEEIQDSVKKISKIIGTDFKYYKALFAISSLGLGHATRTLPIIKYYIDVGFKLKIISYGNTLKFLKCELKNYTKKIKFLEIEDYPALERGKGLKFYYYLLIDVLKTNTLIKYENNFIKDLGKFDFIFSDGKYGIYNELIPSFLLSHQISFILPRGLSIFINIVNYFNYKYLKKFNTILIPDFKDGKRSLAGDLSHTKFLKKLDHHYIGLLTSYNNLKQKHKNIDYYFIISGYLEEHKQNFINKLIYEAKKLKGKKVFVLGNTSKNNIVKIHENNIIIYSYVSSEQRLDLFSRSKIIISRAGYTTIMDLIANNKKAILFPTTNQTEQEYLSRYLDKKGLFVSGGEGNINLGKLIKKLG